MMRLYYSESSPYARKVRLLVREKHLGERVQELISNPFDEAPELTAANPLGKVPTLVLGDGESLFDSPLLCAYLDSLSPEPRLIPEAGQERWRVLRWRRSARPPLNSSLKILQGCVKMQEVPPTGLYSSMDMKFPLVLLGE